MSFSAVKVFANCDVTTIVWQTDAIIPNCRGFAIERQVSGAVGTAGDDFVRTWVGFQNDPHTKGESQPSTVWPVQRFIWSDFLVSQGQKVRYRIIPMLRLTAGAQLTQAPATEWSEWTPFIVVGTQQTPGFSAYFNRGIVPAQVLARQANSSAQFTQMLKTDISTPGSKNRDFLSGPLRIALLSLLQTAKLDGVEVFAALYELNDPEIIAALTALGSNCNLILASGAYSSASGNKPAVPDENAAIRATLRSTTKINLFDRLVTSPHFAHNKFIVINDKSGKPSKVWTGSTNCTVNGLCTQVNNGLLVESPNLAAGYFQRWTELRDAASAYPPTLAQQGSTPTHDVLNGSPMTAWQAPTLKFVDMADATAHIQSAQQGVLFLMFNPGVGDGTIKPFSLEQVIHNLDPTRFFIHGVINQLQKDDASATLQLTNRGTQLPPVSLDEITPTELTDATSRWFSPEFRFNSVMIHSKVVVVDPFGPRPVVMTGSHNLGPKASESNDDNLLIIENAPGLAAEYAVNILGVYAHYKWLYNLHLRTQTGPQAATTKALVPHFDGLLDDDTWQQWYRQGPNLRELQFWLNLPPTPASAAPPVTPPIAAQPAPPPSPPAKAKKNPAPKKSTTKKTSPKEAAKRRVRKTAPAKTSPAKKTATKKAAARKAAVKKMATKKAAKR